MKKTEIALCPFCGVPEERVRQSTALVVALQDGYPVAEGHTLVVPRRHVGRLEDCTTEELADLWRAADGVRAALTEELSPPPDGFNIGVNDGEAAGQTVGHLHVHVIPRWIGDVEDPRGGVRWVIPERAVYWSESTCEEDD